MRIYVLLACESRHLMVTRSELFVITASARHFTHLSSHADMYGARACVCVCGACIPSVSNCKTSLVNSLFVITAGARHLPANETDDFRTPAPPASDRPLKEMIRMQL